MSKALLYTVNTNIGAIEDGGNVSFGNIIRRYGNKYGMPIITINGEDVILHDGGYYSDSITINATASAEGTITATLLQDGVPVQGANASTTATSTVLDVKLVIPMNAVKTKCLCGDSILNVRISGGDLTGGSAVLWISKE